MRAWIECDNVHKRVFCEKYENAHIKLSFALTQWRAEGEGRMGRWPRASKVRGHPKREITKIKML